MIAPVGLVQRLRLKLETAPHPVPLETLGRELFFTANGSVQMVCRLLEPLLKEIPEAEVLPNGCVAWLPRKVQPITLRETTYAVVDVETTGSSTRYARVTEIAIYRIERGAIVSEFSTLVNPQMFIPELITSLTGITNAMVAEAPQFAEIIEPVSEQLRDSVIVGHNVNFDYSFLNLELALADTQVRLTNPSLCTVKLARTLVPGLENYRLHTVAAHYGIEIKDRHRAGGDAFATARLFLELIDLLDEAGIQTVFDAQRLKRHKRRSYASSAHRMGSMVN